MNTNDSTNAQSQDNAAAKPLGMLAHQIEMPKDNSPAWKFVDILKSPPIGPDEAKVIIEARPVPGNLHKPGASPAIKAAIATGSAGNTVGGPASIVELARALRNDVDLIYEWVFNNIETLPNYGLHKGALGALLDGFGTAFDQSDLLVKLLRQAGYTANYVTGTLSMDAANLGAWLGTDTTNVFASYNMLIGSGTPVALVFPNLEFSHCWVECTIGGTIYTFDPARKTYTTKSKIDLATAMGYNQATFLSRANTGATITADYVQNMNRANIRADLDTFSNNLVSWIKTNNHGAGLDDILGGRNIVQNDAAVPTRQIGNPFLKSGSTPTVWTALPQSLKATMGTVFDTINVTFNTEDLAGKRLTLFWNASHQAELRLDGTLLATSSARAVGASTRLDLTITHPYAVTWYNTINAGHFIVTDKPHLICNSFGAAGRGASQFHSRRMKANLAAGMATTDEAVFGELLGTTWKMWDASQNKVADITNRLTNCTTMYHHQCGVMGWYDTPLTNLGAVVAATAALDNNYTQRDYNDTVIAMHGVALEAQIFNQFAKIDGVSTTPLVDIASSAGQKIYDAKTANWLSTVKPALVNYSAGTLSDIEFFVNTLGERVGVPENGSITRGSWVGYGYYRIPTFGTFGIIGGALKGGGGSCALPVDDWVKGANCKNTNALICGGGGTYDCQRADALLGISGNGGGGASGVSNNNPVVSEEPIDMVSGDYLLTQSDLSIGSMSFPYGLAFIRTYNSSSRYQDGPLGLGWRHNFQIEAQKTTDALMGLGAQSTVAAAAAIAELFVAVDVQSDLSKPFDKYITCSLATQWFIDNLSNNGVLISFGQRSLMFIKLRDGSFTPPYADNGTVIQNVDGTFTYKTLIGARLNFNSAGQIATWVEPYGVTVTFGYTGNLLSTVSNGLSRTLTLNYTGTRLTSVADGTGRTVGYSVDANKNLTTVTDPNSKNLVYEYDLPGRMTKFYLPANPATAISANVYDSLGRVKEQRDYQNNLWQYFFAGSRSQEINPNGKTTVRYNNSFGLPFKTINLVGKKFVTEFDGRARAKRAIAPEGNIVEFQYDSLDRTIQTTTKAKPASGLPDIVKTSTYDPVWGKLKTVTDNMGRITTNSYDPITGTLLSTISPNVTGVGSSVVTLTYTARGQVETVTAPDGKVMKHTYNALTETLSSTVSDFGVGRLNLTANFTYNSRGMLISAQDPRGFTTTVDFDVLGRVTQTTSPAPFSYVTKFTYDDNGNRTKIERQTNDPANPWQTSLATYTADNKVSSITSPSGSVRSFEYDVLQRHWKTTDELSRVETKTFDDANRLSFVTQPGAVVAESYTYTDNGYIAAVTDSRGFATNYSYDGHDRVVRTTFPDTSFQEIQGFDGNSNPLIVRTRSGSLVTLTYDELNRIKTKSPNGQPTVTTVYDVAGRVASVSTPVVAGDPSSGTFSSFYDTAGRFLREQYPDGLSVSHILDANGNVTKTTYPDGFFVEKVFDALGRLTDIKLNGSGSSALQVQYDALSRRTKLLYENGCSSNSNFDPDNGLTDLLHNFVGSSVGLNYVYDTTGQMVTQRVTDPANYRWAPGTPSSVTYGTANNINQYPSVGGTAYTYSSDGNLTNDGNLKFEYNTERMLTRVRNAGTNAIISDYLYDPVLRQRQKNVGGVKTNYYYSGWQRLADYDGTTNTLQQRYVYGADLDEVLIQISSGGTKTYFHGNNQGSIIAISNAAGAIVSTNKYSPYGESSPLTASSHGYCGQRYDAETGLYYFKMRYYSPRLGRFLQPDPAGYADGLNLYAYVGNSPLQAVDPMGLATQNGGGTSGSGGPVSFYGNGPDQNYLYRYTRDAIRGKSTSLIPGRGGADELNQSFGDYVSKYSDFAKGDIASTTDLGNWGVQLVVNYLVDVLHATIEHADLPNPKYNHGEHNGVARLIRKTPKWDYVETAYPDIMYSLPNEKFMRFAEVKARTDRMPTYTTDVRKNQKNVYNAIAAGRGYWWPYPPQAKTVTDDPYDVSRFQPMGQAHQIDFFFLQVPSAMLASVELKKAAG